MSLLRVVYIVIGTLALCLGIIGIVLPVLPTTPFLLLSAACYLRGSKTLYKRLLACPHIGHYILIFREQKAIPLHAKIVSVSMIWISLGYCAGWVVAGWYLKTAFMLLAVLLTSHILSYKTLKH